MPMGKIDMWSCHTPRAAATDNTFSGSPTGMLAYTWEEAWVLCCSCGNIDAQHGENT